MWDHDANRPLRGAKTHAADCYVVDPNRPGKRHEFRKVAIADLPEDVGRCEICGGGRPPSEARLSQLPSQPNRASMPSQARSLDDAIAPGQPFTARDEKSGEDRAFILGTAPRRGARRPGLRGRSARARDGRRNRGRRSGQPRRAAQGQGAGRRGLDGGQAAVRRRSRGVALGGARWPAAADLNRRPRASEH